MAKVPGAGKPNPQKQTPINPLIPSVPEDGKLNTNQGHRVSDVDSSKLSQHHTLGTGANQSSPGNHTHDGIDSNLISQLTDQSLIKTYNPVWFATGVEPTIGNGQIRGWYYRVGQLCYFSMHLLMGSTTTYGTGLYFFTVPFACYPGPYHLIPGLIQNDGAQWPATAFIESSALNLYYITPATSKTGGLLNDSIGAAGWKTSWGVGDYMTFSGWFLVDLEASPL